MTAFAAATTVPVEQSRLEIERTLVRYGASAFAYGWSGDQASIQFEAHCRRVRFIVPLPRKDAAEFTRHSRGQRTPEQAAKLWEQACRQRWRALTLVVKAKLEAVAAGISCFEDEFLAHIQLPDGQTVGDVVRSQIAVAYELGTSTLELLPGN